MEPDATPSAAGGDPPNRWRFGLRGMLCLVFVASAVFGLIGFEVRQWRREQAAVDELRSVALFQYQPRGLLRWKWAVYAEARQTNRIMEAGGSTLTLLRQVERLTPSQARRLSDLKYLDSLALDDDVLAAELSIDRLLDEIVRCENLRVLSLRGLPIDDDHLQRLAVMPYLREVNLESTGVTDWGIDDLRRIRPDIEVWDD